METPTDYPCLALNRLLDFANDNLPYPQRGFDYMEKMLNHYYEALLSEVKTALKTLPPNAISHYGNYLDKRMFKFSCIPAEAYYDPVTDTHKVSEHRPYRKKWLLEEPNPELRQFKYKLTHKTYVLQNYYVNALDDTIWALHPELNRGRNDESEQRAADSGQSNF